VLLTEDPMTAWFGCSRRTKFLAWAYLGGAEAEAEGTGPPDVEGVALDAEL
jgi:hypothetical protein